MSKIERLHAFRALLTETLPYEVPVIFSNDTFYASLVREPASARVQGLLRQLRRPPSSHTRPYQYLIRKERQSWNTLSLIHPLSQIKASEFYHDYAETILSECNKSPATLRRPSSVASILTTSKIYDIAAPKTGAVHKLVVDDELDVSRIVSYFVYRDFNLLAKFYESEDFISLEKRYSRFQALDVRKCFFNIYTHSLTWAVKSKDFSKKFRNLASFESKFDELMQKNNYNETNGIVVGPEFSRIFAEIIFQQIDRLVIDGMESRQYRWGIDYEFRRYVDDFLIFSDSASCLDVFRQVLESSLENYKLYLNESKSEVMSRPFVSRLTIAKREIKKSLSALSAAVSDIGKTGDSSSYRSLTEAVEDKTRDLRVILSSEAVGLHNVSGWSLSFLRYIVRRIFGNIPDADNPERLDAFEKAALSVLKLVFYICSLDIRVRSTYTLNQILSVISEPGYKKLGERSDWIEHFIQEELIDLATLACRKHQAEDEPRDSVELFNILICGAYFYHKDFVLDHRLRELICGLVRGKFSYFRFVSLKFVLLVDPVEFEDELALLNSKALDFLADPEKPIFEDSEAYLTFCDLLSSPDLGSGEKLKAWRGALGGTATKSDMEELSAWVGFIDWAGLRIEHTLRRKSLRPAYE